MTKRKAHSTSKLSMRLAHRIVPIVLAVIVILLGGVLAWVVLGTLNEDEGMNGDDSVKHAGEQLNLYRLGDWDAALALPNNLTAGNLTSTERKSTTGELEAVVLTTKKGAENARRCGIDDGGLVILYRQSTPMARTSQLMAATGKIGDYYYVYERAVDTLAPTACTDDERTALENETRRLERIVSTIQRH